MTIPIALGTQRAIVVLMNTTQLHFGLMSGVEQVAPFAHGDIVVKADGRRYVIMHADDNADGGVFVCVNLSTGADAVVLEREIAYRSR